MNHSQKPDQKQQAAAMPPGVLYPQQQVQQGGAHLPVSPYSQHGAPSHIGNNGGSPPHGLTPTDLLQEGSESDDMILYRSGRFLVHTANRPDQRRNPLRKRSGNTSIFGASFISQVRWVTAEKQRITEADTRLLPGIESINPALAKAIPFPLILEALVVLIGLIIAMAAHALN
ncbi:MAG: hypothetical protein M3Y76_13735, partial [Chloroflexota bacterium]|nr:hypothetical protein [Chloroflexota bacterium]